MPFIKNRSDTPEWKPSTPDDVALIRDSIINYKKPDPDTPLPVGLKEKVQDAITNMVPGFGIKIVANANHRLYTSMAAFLSQTDNVVDVIIPVYNAIHIAEKCVKSVLDHTIWPYHITIVDDASDSTTHKVLRQLANKHPDEITLVTNNKNRGFSASINRGIKSSNGAYVVLLNSDVLVTPRWLTKMVMAIESDKRNQIVNPVTNNTAMINVAMSEGASYLTMNKVFERYAQRRYPEVMPTGFCFMFRRELLSKIGYFDESYSNYGEESDFWMRTITRIEGIEYPRYKAVMADDTYLFHERGSSFSSLGEYSHLSLRQTASSRFHKIWPQFAHWKQTFNIKKTLGSLRAPIPADVLNNMHNPRYRICWVVHSTGFCGGMKYIADIVNEINERGGDARVALIKRDPESDKPIETLTELRSAPIVFKSAEEFISTFKEKVFGRGIVVAATSELARAVKELTNLHPKLNPLLHVQSYEPDMTNDVKLQFSMKEAFKLIPEIVSNSGWISEKLKKELGVFPFATILPGVDQRLFYPRDRSTGDERPTVMIPMVKGYGYRGYNRGVELINALWSRAEKDDKEIRILVYGVDSVPKASMAIGLGPLSQPRLAKLLGTEVDVFVDPSTLHSYGMPALEAIASGVRVVGWDNKGIREYIKDDRQGVVKPADTSPREIAEEVYKCLVENKKMSVGPWKDLLSKNNRPESVNHFIDAMEERFKLSSQSRRIVMVTPHLRKHGGPTTILSIANELSKRGHDVSVTTVYTDVNPEVTAMTDLPIHLDPHQISKCDILITNSDNPMNAMFSTLPQAKKKILLKLSHNERFKQLEDEGLKCKWDAVVTSTEWLKEVCAHPLPDWSHLPVQATRIGWYHYSHERMKAPPSVRQYGDGKSKPIIIGTLIHQHALKGTKDALEALQIIKQKYGDKIGVIGVGELGRKHFRPTPWMQYIQSPTRDQMAEVLSQIDIWIGASHTEGLGRMALEAMSAGAACVVTDTGAEFAKHEDNCLLVPVENPNAIAGAIGRLMEDPQLFRRLYIAGYRTAEAAADPTECIDRLQNVISEVLGE